VARSHRASGVSMSSKGKTCLRGCAAKAWHPAAEFTEMHRTRQRDWNQIGVADAPVRNARKKSSQKSTRPRGAKDAVTFPGAIGRNNACVRADAQPVAEGGGATAARRGVYRSGWLASVPMPTAAGPVPAGPVAKPEGRPFPRGSLALLLGPPDDEWVTTAALSTTTCPGGLRRGPGEYGRRP